MAEELGLRIRREMLLVIEEEGRKGSERLQVEHVLSEVGKRIGGGGQQFEQAVLTVFGDFFRTGHLAWGFNFSNARPPFFHVTEQGRKALEHMGRDPSNPAGYLAHLATKAIVNAVAQSYVREALDCYNADCVRAAAVMTGVASEALVRELAAVAIDRLKTAGEPVPKDLADWRARRVLQALAVLLDSKKGTMPQELREAVDAFWPAFTHQVRMLRNDAGHPASVSSVSNAAAHASLLVFPEIAEMAARVKYWMESGGI